MRRSTNFALAVAGVLFGLLLVTQAAMAQAINCPAEPARVPIASGNVFVGPNCVLHTPGDVDSFVFNANNGDVYWLYAAEVNEVCTQDIGLALYGPNSNTVPIFQGYTSSCSGGYTVGTASQTLTATGRYTLAVTEAGTAGGTRTYGVSIERLHPFPPNAQQITLGQPVTGVTTPLIFSDAFTWEGVTTGSYLAKATMPPSGCRIDMCMTVYSADGTVAPQQCTNSCSGQYTIQLVLEPSKKGALMALLDFVGNNVTFDYTLDVSCLAGQCGSGFPPCTLTDKLMYDSPSSTLTMNFTVGTNTAATWNAWLTYQDTFVPVFPSILLQKTVPPAPMTKTYTLTPQGKVGVLSTLTTPPKGIACSSWELYDTGTAP